MGKEYIAGETQRYEIGGRVFIVEPRYRKDGESMADILLMVNRKSMRSARKPRKKRRLKPENRQSAPRILPEGYLSR